tara:strand:- start:484131 stop:484328 length:198 start_codon:yes stop_codon:yes gene_type:complete
MAFRDSSIEEALQRSKRFRERAIGSLASDLIRLPTKTDDIPADFIQPDVESVFLAEENKNDSAGA